MATPTPSTSTPGISTAAARREALDHEALDRIADLLSRPMDVVTAIEMDAIAKVVRATGRPTPQHGGPTPDLLAGDPEKVRARITGSVPFTLDEARNTREAIRLFRGLIEQLPEPAGEPLHEAMADDLERVQVRLSELCRRLTELAYLADAIEPF